MRYKGNDNKVQHPIKPAKHRFHRLVSLYVNLCRIFQHTGLSSFSQALLFLLFFLLFTTQAKPATNTNSQNIDSALVSQLYDSVQQQIDAALVLAKQKGVDSLIAKAYVNRAIFFLNKLEYKKAAANFKKAFPYFRKQSGKQHDWFETLVQLANCYYYLFVPDSVLFYSEMGLAPAQKENNKVYLSAFYSGMGTYYEMKERWAAALQYYYRALELAEALHRHSDMGSEMLNIGIIYESTNDTIDALKYYKNALKIGQKYHLNEIISPAINNLCNLNNDSSEAVLNDYIKTFELDKKLDDKYGMALSYNNFGIAYGKMGKLKKERKYFLKSYRISLKNDFKEVKLLVLFNLGEFYADSSKYYHADSAIYYYSLGLKLANKMGKREDAADYLEELQQI